MGGINLRLPFIGWCWVRRGRERVDSTRTRSSGNARSQQQITINGSTNAAISNRMVRWKQRNYWQQLYFFSNTYLCARTSFYDTADFLRDCPPKTSLSFLSYTILISAYEIPCFQLVTVLDESPFGQTRSHEIQKNISPGDRHLSISQHYGWGNDFLSLR